ncbi:MAG: hypothetical protein ACOYI9_09940 [Candidatus Hydrogenedentales bacterium]|jgi:hypothetical protein
MKRGSDKKGFILVTAALVISMLAVLCMCIAHWTQIQLAESNYRQIECQMERYMDNALIGAVYLIQNGGHHSYCGSYKTVDEPQWFDESTSVTVKMMINDLGGRIPINHANPLILKEVLKEIWGSDADVRPVIAAIEDWRGTAPNPRFNLSYGMQDPPYSARHAPLKRIEELLYVEGISAAQFWGSLAVSRPGDDTPFLTQLSDTSSFSGLYDYLHAHPRLGLSVNGVPPHVWRVLLRAALFDRPGAAERIIPSVLALRFGADGVAGTNDDLAIESPQALFTTLGDDGMVAAQRLNEWLNFVFSAQAYEIRIHISSADSFVIKESVALVVSDGAGRYRPERFAYVR